VPGKPDKSFVSMGVYIFDTEALVKNVIADAKDPSSDHDFGKNVVPRMLEDYRVYVHSFQEATNKSSTYWRDIGTLDAYWEANMDLVSPDPQCNLYDDRWLIRTFQEQVPPAKTIFVAREGEGDRVAGMVRDSIISGGCVISGGTVIRSVLSPNVEVGTLSRVEDSVLLDGVTVGREAHIRKAIVDRDIFIPDRYSIGLDREQDLKRFTISSEGVVVVPHGIRLE